MRSAMNIRIISARMVWPILFLALLFPGLLPVSAYQVHYAYDNAGRLRQADYGGGQTIDYATDANGNLLSRSASSGAEFMLVYTALAGGAIDGVATQIVALGGSGSSVTAVTNPFYAFVQWSDGLGTAGRTETNVQANLAVSAQFAAILAANGTPHWWLAQHYPGTNDFDAAEASNTDGDPFTAGQEYAADTSPTNGTDFFFLFDAESPLLGNAIRFQSSAGRLYTLQGTPPLAESVWSNIPGQGPRMGTGGADSMVPPGESAAQLYRIRVSVP